MPALPAPDTDWYVDTLIRSIPTDGVSVHFVTEELDGGPVILQAKVPVLADDTADTLF